MPSVNLRLLSPSSQPDTAAPGQTLERSQRRTTQTVIRDHTVLRPLQPRPQQGPQSGTSSGSAGLHDHRVKKKQRKPSRPPKSTKTTTKSAVGKAQDPPHELDSGEDSGSVIASDDGVRWNDGLMEWHDVRDGQWKPARYHRDCRAELIRLAAQQPGAEVWTPDMGTDYTSFTYLTRGWNEDPLSVRDAKGRQVFLMNQPPADHCIKARYNVLTLDGDVLLDYNNKAVLDIPGLPLTLKTDLEGWFVAGLRRACKIEIKDILARVPQYYHTKRRRAKPVAPTRYTTSAGRWLQENDIAEWYPRGKARAKWEAKRWAKAKIGRWSTRTTELDFGGDRVARVLPSVMGAAYGHDLDGYNAYRRENPYASAVQVGASWSPPETSTDEAWTTSRETSIFPDRYINASHNRRYPLPPSYHGNDDAWAMTREPSMLPDPEIHLPASDYRLPHSYHGSDDAWATTREPSMLPDPYINSVPDQYPLQPPGHHPPPASYHHPSFAFPTAPPTYHSDHSIEDPSHENIFNNNDGLNLHDDIYGAGDNVLDPQGMMNTGWEFPDMLNEDMMIDPDFDSGLGNP